MTKIQRAYKYRLYPNKTQQTKLDQNFGAVRFLWNALVANFNAYGTPEHVKNLSEINLKQNNPWMHDRRQLRWNCSESKRLWREHKTKM